MSVQGTRTKQLTNSNPRAVAQTRAVFFTSAVGIYGITILVSTLTLNAYFAQTWDVETFIQAAHRFLDGGNPFDLYAASRAAQTWPYAYPPLHALVTAPFLWVGKLLPIAPDYLWARLPAMIADIAVGCVLYAVVARQSADQSLARIAMLLWLFNPVTFYDTAVQGHFEGEWLLFVALAYYWHEKSRGLILPTIALAIALLFKQIAILYVIPFWIYTTFGETKEPADPAKKILQSAQSENLKRVLVSVALFAVVTLGVCLPYLLYSNDFLFMNLTYVENVPVQTQSWVVTLLALTRPTPDAMTSDFFFLRSNTLISILAAVAISIFAARRRYSLWLNAALITIAFFLISRKVMGYYYVMLFPFLIAEFLPRRRFGIILGALGLTAWISLSPYYAPWANPAHIWLYAAFGAINSGLFVWLFISCTAVANPPTLPLEGRGSSSPSLSQTEGWGRTAVPISLGLFACAELPALMQPLAPSGGSPIRLPIIAAGSELSVLAAFAAVLALITAALWLASRRLIVPRSAWIVVLAFAPLFFVVYYLTKESTAVFEWLLNVIGV